jgi:hypothetical protein
MIELIKALIKARAEFPSIQKDKINPHFKVSYASLDSVLDAVTPVLCKHGLAIVQVMEKGSILKTHLFHESGEFLTSEYELPDIQDSQKKGAALTYARRYTVCALLSITADEDDDANSAKDDKTAQKTYNSRQSVNSRQLSIGNAIKQIREFLKVEKAWVINWLSSYQVPSIKELESAEQLIKDMCIDWAISQGVDEFQALHSYTENVKSPDLTSVQKWQQVLRGEFPKVLTEVA